MEPQCTQCHRFIVGATHPGLCMDCRMMAYGQVNSGGKCEYCGGSLGPGHACLSNAPPESQYDSLTYETLSRLMAQGMVGTVASSPYDALNRWRERAERAEAELHRLRVQTANLEIQLNRANQELMHHVRERANGILGDRTMPRDMLTKLIRIAHPDLHNNSELSNEVTRYLLSLRDNK